MDIQHSGTCATSLTTSWDSLPNAPHQNGRPKRRCLIHNTCCSGSSGKTKSSPCSTISSEVKRCGVCQFLQSLTFTFHGHLSGGCLGENAHVTGAPGVLVESLQSCAVWGTDTRMLSWRTLSILKSKFFIFCGPACRFGDACQHLPEINLSFPFLKKSVFVGWVLRSRGRYVHREQPSRCSMTYAPPQQSLV